MRRRAIFGLAASCLLASCAHQEPEAMPGMAWSLHASPQEGAKLAYGQPNSDNVVLMLTCAPASGRVTLSLLANAENAPGAIELVSKGRRARFEGQVGPAGLGAGAVVEAEAPAADPTLASFERTGELFVVENGRRATLPVKPAERQAVSSFFAACRSA